MSRVNPRTVGLGPGREILAMHLRRFDRHHQTVLACMPAKLAGSAIRSTVAPASSRRAMHALNASSADGSPVSQ